VEFSIRLIAILGLLGVGRGILILKDSARNPGNFGRAMVHIIGGVLCVNFQATLRMLGNSLGAEFKDVIDVLTG
jgi:hypothetical protein